MIGPGIHRELARQRDQELARDAVRTRTRRTAPPIWPLPAVGVALGLVLAIALGSPTGL
jgi:hypothetical protein